MSPNKVRSPIKTTYSPSKSSTTLPTNSSSPLLSRSPIKTVTSTRSTTYHDDSD